MKIPYSFIQRCNDLNVDISTCTLTAYHAFSLHLQDIYLDAALTTKLRNPIKLNALNISNINLSSNPYRLIITDDKNKQILDDFNVVGVPDGPVSAIAFDSVKDSAGSTQFSASSINKSLMFASSGAISLAFDPSLNKITITGNGGASYIAGSAIKIATNTISVGNIQKGGILVGNGANADASILPIGVKYNNLVIDDLGNPSWGTVNLSSNDAVSGILPVAKGGTGLASLGSLGLAILSYSSSSSGFLTWNGSSFSINTNNYLIANQTITLSGDVSGSGTTAITVSVNKILGNTIPSNATGVLFNNGSGVLSWVPISGGGGTVTSVGLSAPSIFTVSNSPVITSGTLGFAWNGASTDFVLGDGTTVLRSNYLLSSAISGTAGQVGVFNGVNSISSSNGLTYQFSELGVTGTVAIKDIAGTSSIQLYSASLKGYDLYYYGGGLNLNEYDTSGTLISSVIAIVKGSTGGITIGGISTRPVSITSLTSAAVVKSSSGGTLSNVSGPATNLVLVDGSTIPQSTFITGGPYLPISGGTETGMVTFAAGTTTLAPISFQAGSLLTRAVAHRVEWNGTNIYVTNSTTTRKQIAYVDSTMTGLWNGTVISPVYGGTGLSSYAIGDILYANTTSSLAKLAAAATGNALLSGTYPSWGKIGLTTHVSGILPVANGGTGLSTLGTLGTAILSYSSGSPGYLRWNGTTYAIDNTLISLANLSATSPILYSNTTGVISHASTDGNLHVPATGTTNSGRVLTAGATAGSLSWTTPTTGTGTINTIPKWTTSSSLGNSSIIDSGSLVTVSNQLTCTGTITSTANPSINGTISAGQARMGTFSEGYSGNWGWFGTVGTNSGTSTIGSGLLVSATTANVFSPTQVMISVGASTPVVVTSAGVTLSPTTAWSMTVTNSTTLTALIATSTRLVTVSPSGVLGAGAVYDGPYLPLAAGSGSPLSGVLYGRGLNFTTTANAPITIAMNVAGGFTHPFQAFNSGMVAGNQYNFDFGQAASTNNSGNFGFKYVGAGLSTNYVTLGLYGANDLLKITGAGAATFSGSVITPALTVGTLSGTLIGTSGVVSALSGTNLVLGNGTTISQSTFATPAQLSGYLPLTGGTLSGNLTFSDDGEGVFFNGGAAIYKKSGTGIVIRLHAANTNLQIENNAATVLGSVWYGSGGTLNNLNQLTNGPGYITSSSLSSYLPLAGGSMNSGATITVANMIIRNYTSGTTNGAIYGNALTGGPQNTNYGLYIEANGNSSYLNSLVITHIAVGGSWKIKAGSSLVEVCVPTNITGSVSGTQAVLQVSNTGTAGNRIATFFSPNVATGNNVSLGVGVAGNINQSAFLTWIRRSPETDSYLDIETHSSANPINIKSSLLTITSNMNVSGDTTGSRFIATSNGAGTNFRVGDDLWIGDVNQTHTARLSGVTDSTQAFLQFGNAGPKLGYNGATFSLDSSISITGNSHIYVATTRLGVQQINSSAPIGDLSAYWVKPQASYTGVLTLPSTPSVGCAFCIINRGHNGTAYVGDFTSISAGANKIAHGYTSLDTSVNIPPSNGSGLYTWVIWDGNVWYLQGGTSVY